MSKSNYHHGDLRRALIEAAVELAVEHGPDGVSMREAARRAGVSTAAPYRHFKDRDELMSAVAAEGHMRLLAQMREAAEASGEGPRGQYRAYGVRYVTFAVKHPNLFRVMHVARWCERDASPEMAQARDANEGEVGALIRRASEEGELEPDALATQQLAAHALMYGLARLYIDGHGEDLGLDQLDVQTVVEAVADVLGRGLVPR